MYEKTLEMDCLLDDLRNRAVDCANLGFVYSALLEWDKALEYYERSLLINQHIDSKSGMGYDYSCLGDIYGKLGKYERARDCFAAALHIFNELGMGEEVRALKMKIRDSF
jgi:tetratricopeptide (TPR) repeat protein